MVSQEYTYRGVNMLRSYLKQIVDEKGLRYGFVAKKVGIANSTMTNLLQGDRRHF